MRPRDNNSAPQQQQGEPPHLWYCIVSFSVLFFNFCSVLQFIMHLNGLDKLLARLYLKIRPGQREKLVTCARLPRAVESSVRHSTIKYLKCVRKRSRSIEQFLKTLTEYFKTLDDSHDLLYLLESFHRVYPRLEELEGEPEVVVSRCTASEDQKTAFTCLLVRMSNEFSDDNLEILVALSPTPEGKKDSLTSGVKLFAELQCHGCITEENIDLLDDLFRVLKLAELMKLLEQYREVSTLLLFIQ